MFNAELSDPQAVLEAVLEGSDTDALVTDARARVVACTDGMADRLGVAPSRLRPGAPAPEIASQDSEQAVTRTRVVRGQQVVTWVRRQVVELSAVAAMARERNWLRETFDAVDVSITVFDADLRFVAANQTFHTLFPGLPDDDALHGMPFAELMGAMLERDLLAMPVPPEHRAAHIAYWEALVRAGYPPREYFDRRQGRWYQLRMSRLTSGGRMVARVELDAQKRLQKHLLWQREAAAAALRRLQDGVASLQASLATLEAATRDLHDPAITAALDALRTRLARLATPPGTEGKTPSS